MSESSSRREFLQKVGKAAYVAPIVMTMSVRPALAQVGSGGGGGGGQGTYTIGYWKTHESLWPVTQLTIGGVVYNQSQLLNFLNTPPQGNKRLILIHQLIGAKLSIANGSDGSVVAQTIIDADALLALTNPTNAQLAQMVTLAGILDDYNNGVIGPGHAP